VGRARSPGEEGREEAYRRGGTHEPPRLGHQSAASVPRWLDVLVLQSGLRRDVSEVVVRGQHGRVIAEGVASDEVAVDHRALLLRGDEAAQREIEDCAG